MSVVAPSVVVNELEHLQPKALYMRLDPTYRAFNFCADHEGFRVPAVEHEPDFAALASQFGEKMRHRAHDLKLTQRDVIELTGISRSYLQSLWNGRGSNREPDGSFKPPNPTMDVIWRISVALEVDKGYLTDTDRGIGDFHVVPRPRR